jgi:hypothetical protein
MQIRRALFYRLGMIVSTLAYIVVLHWSYVSTITPSYAYMGCTYRPHSTDLLLLSWTLAAVPSFWIPVGLTRPSLYLYWILYVTVYIPACIVPTYMGSIHDAQVITLDLALLLALILIGLAYRIPLLRLPSSPSRPVRFWMIIGLTSILLYGIVVAVFGLRFRFVQFSDVYNVRASYVDTIQGAGALVAYALMWQTYALNPLFLAHGLVNRRPIPFVAGALGQLLVYAITAFKSVLFSTVCIAAVWMSLRLSRRAVGALVPLGASVLILCSSAAYHSFGSVTLTSIVTHRTFVVPGQITGYYVQYFTSHPHTLLGDGILRGLVPYPYTSPPAFVVGDEYFPGTGMDANANFWAYGYACFGYIGVLAFSTLLGLVLWLYDSVATTCDYRIAALLLSVSAFQLANSSLFTWLLTHGAGIVLVLAWTFPRSVSTVRASSGGTARGHRRQTVFRLRPTA